MKYYIKLENSLKREFQNYHSSTLLPLYRVSFIIGIILYIGFGYLDIFALPQTKNISWFIRFYVICPMIISLFFSFHKAFKKVDQLVISFSTLLAGIGIILMISFSEKSELGFYTYYAGLSLVILYSTVFIRLLFAILTNIIILIIFITVLNLLNITPSSKYLSVILLNNLFFILSNILLGILGSFFIDYYKKKSFLQTIEIESKNLQISSELKLARIFQQSFIPNAPSELNGVKFSTFYLPMKEVGGDFFDFIYFKEQNLIGIFISDVSGHGVPAALITGMLKSLIQSFGRDKLHPNVFLEKIHSELKKYLSDQFITAFYGIYDCEDKKLRYARAGHPYPILIRDNHILELEGKGKILGMIPDPKIEKKFIQLKTNDKLLFFTDGLTETLNQKNEMYEENLKKTVLRDSYNNTINEFIKNIYTDLLVFSEKRHFEDDICMIGMQIL